MYRIDRRWRERRSNHRAPRAATGPAAGALIAMSVVADTFDGRFAGRFRRTDTQRKVGVQLDSLSVFVTAAAMVLLLPVPRPRGLGVAAFTCWPLVLVAVHIAGNT